MRPGGRMILNAAGTGGEDGGGCRVLHFAVNNSTQNADTVSFVGVGNTTVSADDIALIIMTPQSLAASVMPAAPAPDADLNPIQVQYLAVDFANGAAVFTAGSRGSWGGSTAGGAGFAAAVVEDETGRHLTLSSKGSFAPKLGDYQGASYPACFAVGSFSAAVYLKEGR